MEKFTLRKTILKSYSKSKFLIDPAEKDYGNVLRKKNRIDFVFVRFYLYMKSSTLKLRFY